MSENPHNPRQLSPAALQDVISILAEAWVLDAGRRARKRRLRIVRRLIQSPTADPATRGESAAFVLGIFGVAERLRTALER